MEEKLQQLETRKVMEPIDRNEMTREKKGMSTISNVFEAKKKRKDQRM